MQQNPNRGSKAAASESDANSNNPYMRRSAVNSWWGSSNPAIRETEMSLSLSKPSNGDLSQSQAINFGQTNNNQLLLKESGIG